MPPIEPSPASSNSDPDVGVANILPLELDPANCLSGASSSSSSSSSPHPHMSRRLKGVWIFLVGAGVTGVFILQGTASQLLNLDQDHADALSSTWKDNDPPVALQPGETVQSLHTKQQQRLETQKETDNSLNKKKGNNQKNIPIIQESDDETPVVPVDVPVVKTAGSVFTTTNAFMQFPRHAAQSLQCRESVVNFVINATDGKDECEGLRKAFDKTCSNDDGDDDTSGSGNNNERRRRHLQQEQTQTGLPRVTMWEKTRRTFRWHAFLFETYRSLYQWLEYLFTSTLSGNAKDPFFFAEDAVIDAWDDAAYLVELDLDYVIHDDLRRRWQLERRAHLLHDNATLYSQRRQQQQQQHHQRQRHLEMAAAGNTTFWPHFDHSTHPYSPIQLQLQQHHQLQQRRRLELTTSSATNNETVLPATISSSATTTTNKTVVRPSISLELPTFNTHLSEHTLSETLMLQQGENLIVKATKNQSQILASEDAAASTKAMKESSAAVSALLNDPSSVQARTCCASILNTYHENCSVDAEEDVSDSRLVFVVCVMACCGVVKSLIRHFRILWLPEAAGCIIVGVLSGYGLMIFPHHEMSFDGNWFLRILVPPIVFEAALGIDKRSFNRHVVPIIMYAVGGTLIATLLTALIVHRGSLLFPHFCSPIPFVEALTFGALISSIDPIAVLSVLSNMGMTDTDTIYVVIFGESLLNDGVAIVLFETLIHFLDENLVIDGEAIFAASVHFVVVAFGSLLVGVGSGMMATVYYWLFHGCQTALVEVLMFFCWALLPYYVCDGIGWSGIVCAVATGFVMDIYVVGEKTEVLADDSGHSRSDQEKDSKLEKERYGIFSTEGHLSEESRTHIGFVTQMIATVMETAIFAYLGLFLFSHRYHWNVFHTVIAIIALCVSRAIMIPALSLLANAITRIQQTRAACRNRGAPRRAIPNAPAGVVIDRKMQIVLWFAGLRGAVSFALVERLSLYDSTTGEGTRLKPELKAMTSASILFSVFVLGGSTYYVMEKLGLAPPNPSKKGQGQAPNFEMKSLVTVPKPRRNNEGADTFSQDDHDSSGVNNTNGASAPFRRQRVQAHANSD